MIEDETQIEIDHSIPVSAGRPPLQAVELPSEAPALQPAQERKRSRRTRTPRTLDRAVHLQGLLARAARAYADSPLVVWGIHADGVGAQ
jgi:hypothetical protein